MIEFDIKNYQPGDSLYLWRLGHPETPVFIGELRMARATKGGVAAVQPGLDQIRVCAERRSPPWSRKSSSPLRRRRP